jgi:hypothetical protein
VSIGNPKPWNPGPAGHQEPAESGIGQSQFRTRQAIAQLSSRRAVSGFLKAQGGKLRGGRGDRTASSPGMIMATEDWLRGPGTGAIRGEANDVTEELLPLLTAEDLRDIAVVSAAVAAACWTRSPPWRAPRRRPRRGREWWPGSGGVRGAGWFAEDPHRSDRRAARGAAWEDRGAGAKEAGVSRRWHWG